MFEAISRRSKTPIAQRAAALAVSVGVYALVLGLALLAKPERGDFVSASADPVLHFPTRITREVKGRGPTVKPPAAPPITRNTHHHMQPPRAVPADPVSVPLPLDPVAAPEPEVNTPASDAPPGADPLGAVDGGASEVGQGPGIECPVGALCSQIGGEQVLMFSSSMTRPLANCEPPAPLAPNAARQMGLEGRVVAQYVVHADGRADAVNILNADAPAIYAEAVRDWIEHCNFSPSQLNGSPYAVRMVQTFHFKSH